MKFKTVRDSYVEFSKLTGLAGMRCPKARFSRSAPGDQFWAASSELAFCEQFIGQLRLLEHDQTIRDSGDVCGARNTQFEQEFLDLFRAETVSAYDWRDRIGDFCVADYLVEHYTVHAVKYSTRFSLHLSRTSSCLPTSDNHGERTRSASATESVAKQLCRDYSRNLLAARRIGAL